MKVTSSARGGAIEGKDGKEAGGIADGLVGVAGRRWTLL